MASSVWNDMIRPRVGNFLLGEVMQSRGFHEFMVAEINDYLAGTIPSSEKRNEIGVKLKTLADSSEKIEALSNSLFGSVDSVYTIATDFSLEQIKDSAKNTITITSTEQVTPVRLFVYAHPTEHCVWAFLQAKGELQRGVRRERLSFTIALNDNILRNADNVSEFAQEIGKFIRKRQGSGGGGKDEEEELIPTLLSQNVQKIEITPLFPTFDPLKIVGSPSNVPDKQSVVLSLTGYILVTRRRTEDRTKDCRQGPATASSSYERR